MYSGDQSWRLMTDDEIDRFLEHAIPDDASEEARERFRELGKNPPEEGNAAETTIDDRRNRSRQYSRLQRVVPTQQPVRDEIPDREPDYPVDRCVVFRDTGGRTSTRIKNIRVVMGVE